MTESRHPPRAIADWILIVGFLALLVLPMVDRGFAIDPSPQLVENRQLAPFPAWPKRPSEFLDYPKRYEAFWNDHFGMRRSLIRSNAWVGFQFGVTQVPIVEVGKREYLFFSGDFAMDSYRGSKMLSDQELKLWRDELQARQDWLARRNTKYLVVVAPDKQSIYPEVVSSRYKKVVPTNLDRWLAHLAKNSNVKVLDLRAPLLNAKKLGDTFFKTDSHWNDLGAYVAYQATIGALRDFYPAMKPRTEGQFMRFERREFSGDLTGLASLVGTVTEPLVEWIALEPSIIRDVRPRDYTPVGSARFAVWESGNPSSPRAVVIHDSYFASTSDRHTVGRTDQWAARGSTFRIIDLLAEQFSRSAFSWQRYFDANFILRENPDIVIEELAERFLVYGPLGQAPRN